MKHRLIGAMRLLALTPKAMAQNDWFKQWTESKNALLKQAVDTCVNHIHSLPGSEFSTFDAYYDPWSRWRNQDVRHTSGHFSVRQVHGEPKAGP
jgi:hypothetical protein